jgi:hypothetical protein
MMHFKTGFYILLCSLFLTGLASCLGGSDSDDYIVSTDAQITAFSLSHDSIPILAKTIFSINNETGEIYNHDSLPYLTDSLLYLKRDTNNVKVTYTSGSGISNLMTLANGKDSVWVKTNDSIDISGALKDNFHFWVFAPSDQKIKKEYTLKINIHQVDPDSIQYTQVIPTDFPSSSIKTVRLKETYYTFTKDENGNTILYQSPDMTNWTRMRLGNFPADLNITTIQSSENYLYAYTETDKEIYYSENAGSWEKPTIESNYSVVSILGYLNPGLVQKGGLALIVKGGEGSTVFAFIENLADLKVSHQLQYGNPVPADFPVADFSVVNNQSPVFNKITLVGKIPQGDEEKGKIPVWTTEDGIHWVELSSDHKGNLPSIEAGSAFLYNNEIWFIGGYSKADKKYEENIYYSRDGGLVWKSKEAKAQAPAGFMLRKNASVVTDTQGIYFYIVGGENQSPLTDIWKGVLNSQTFKE